MTRSYVSSAARLNLVIKLSMTEYPGRATLGCAPPISPPRTLTSKHDKIEPLSHLLAGI